MNLKNCGKYKIFGEKERQRETGRQRETERDRETEGDREWGEDALYFGDTQNERG